MSILSRYVIRKVGRAAARRFEAATRDPAAVQHAKLVEIVERNRDTEYGREHGFHAVRSLRDLRAAVPVVSYQHIKDRMDRIVRGERNVLTAEDPVMFAQTSGTTGDPKYVPVTPTCRGRDHADQMRTWIHHANKDHPTLFRGKVVSLVSPAVEGRTPSRIPFGSTSGHIYKNMPAAVRGTYAIPYDVFEIRDYESKYYVLMRIGIACDVTFLSTANPSSILKLCEMADRHADDLLKDLHDGSLKADLELDPGIRSVVEARLRPAPEKARALEEARGRRGGRLIPADYWPHLALIGSWKGGTVGANVEKFPAWFDPERTGRTAVRDWGYLSSEARGSIPLSDQGSGGVLTVATNVYEFATTEDVDRAPDDSSTWTFLGVEDLEVGKEYYIFFTTTGGLYRYDINDIVEVVGRYNRTPVIEFRRKGRGMTSITGEKVSVNQVIMAFQTTCRELGLDVDHFKAEADVDAARYVFKVEAAAGVPEERRRPLLEALDRNLAGVNIEYKAKRDSLRLNPPVLQVMRTGWYDEEKKRAIAAGKRLFQAKTVILDLRMAGDGSADRDPVEATVTLD